MKRDDTRQSERGATMMLVGVSMIALLAVTALAVDIGVAGARTRDLQQVADLVAVDVARLLDGRSEAVLQSAVDAQAMETAGDNDFPVAGANGTYASGDRQLTVELGCWTHVVGDNGTFDTNCASPDAVRATAEDEVDYRFADVIGFAGDTFDRSATASRMPTAETGIGTVGAGLQTQLDPVTATAGASGAVYVEVLNARLRAAFDTAASIATPPGGAGLDLVGYQGLASSDVSYGDLASAAGFGTPEEMADATMTNGELFEATATALESDGNDVAAAAVRSFAARSEFDANGTTRLGSGPMSFEQGTGTADDPAAARGRINVMDLLVGAATVANGRNFIAYQFNPGIPGVLSATVQASVVESMQWSPEARVGEIVQSAQVRHQVTLSIDGAALGIPGLTAPISLPIVIEGATGEATFSRASCFEPLEVSETQVDAVTSLARFRVGVAQNLQTAGNESLDVTAAVLIQADDYSIETLIHLGINLAWALGQDITGNSDVSLGGGSSSHVFNPYATPNPYQRAQGGVGVDVGTALQSGLTTTLPAVGSANLTAALSTVFANLADDVIDPILHATGVTLGGADVGSRTLDCGPPQLVD